MNQAQLVVLDRAREWVNHVEENESGRGQEGMPTKQELVETLNTLYQNIVGMDEKSAADMAEQYMQNAFARANPTLVAAITQEMYGDRSFDELEPAEREVVNGKLEEYYKIYKTSTVR